MPYQVKKKIDIKACNSCILSSYTSHKGKSNGCETILAQGMINSHISISFIMSNLTKTIHEKSFKTTFIKQMYKYTPTLTSAYKVE